jgi:hypothetical protein
VEASGDGGNVDLGRRLILEAFRLYRVSTDHTRALRNLRHDADLLPQLRDQLDDLLRCIPADQHIEYDVQGLSDQGTDVVVRLTAGGRESYVCFQVKSHREIAESDLVAKLRTQHSESLDHYGTRALWCAVLAADVSTKDVRINARLRGIRKAFSKKPQTAVIDPTNLGGFLQLSHTQMTSLVTLTMRPDGDPILSEARADLRRHPLRSAVLLALVASSLADHHRRQTTHTLAASVWLQGVSAHTPWNPAYDGPPVAASPLADDSPEHLPGPRPVPRSWEPDWSDVDVWAPSLEVLGWLLRPPPFESPERTTEVLVARLPQAVDALADSGDIEIRSDGSLVIEAGAHPALFAFAAEATVRYGLSTENLLGHLVDVLLPPGVGS